MKASLTSLIIFLLIQGMPVHASDPQALELEGLKAGLESLMARVEVLEAENRKLRESSSIVQQETEKLSALADSTKSDSNWSDSLKITGDFRYRYENIDEESSARRERNRIRARVALVATPTDDLEIGIGLASGSDDPVSANQTLGNGGSTKDFSLDLAWASWQVQPGINLIAGKMKNVFYNVGGNGMLWDGDYNPEGLALTYERDGIFVNAAAIMLESDTKRSNHRTSYGIQAGIEQKIDLGNIIAGAGYYQLGTQGRSVYFGAADDFFGNSFTCTNIVTRTGCVYDIDYDELELFAELQTNIGELPFSLFADFVQNKDAGSEDTGWTAGMKLGKASAKNTFEVAYIYQDLEADAVFGLTTDSDFGGGGTDTRGHVLKGSWAINKKWKLALTYLINESNVSGASKDYDRLQLDAAFKF